MDTKKRPSDVNAMAFQIVQEATKEEPTKNPAALSLGKLGGPKGGPPELRNYLPKDARK